MLLKALLKFLIFAQCLGLASLSILDGAGISTFLFLQTGMAESTTLSLNYLISGCLLLIGFSSLVKIRPSLLLVMGVIFAVEALFKTILGGHFASNWTLGAHLVRYGWPLLLGCYLSRASSLNPLSRRDVLFFLRLMISVTFLVHGIEALMFHPKFIDFIIVANAKLLPFPTTEAFAKQALIFIGTVDIIVALLAIVKPKPSVLYYMVFWGALTAGARVVYGGSQGIPDAILRTPHWVIPLMIVWLQYPSQLYQYILGSLARLLRKTSSLKA